MKIFNLNTRKMKRTIFAALLLFSITAKSQVYKYRHTAADSAACDTIKVLRQASNVPGVYIETQYEHLKKPIEQLVIAWVLQKNGEYKRMQIVQRIQSRVFNQEKGWVPQAYDFVAMDRKSIIRKEDIVF
jgi:hypothetical protein